eukprot:1269745-Pleurochrysis_carterae.AAC.1
MHTRHDGRGRHRAVRKDEGVWAKAPVATQCMLVYCILIDKRIFIDLLSACPPPARIVSQENWRAPRNPSHMIFAVNDPHACRASGRRMRRSKVPPACGCIDPSVHAIAALFGSSTFDVYRHPLSFSPSRALSLSLSPCRSLLLSLAGSLVAHSRHAGEMHSLALSRAGDCTRSRTPGIAQPPEHASALVCIPPEIR